MEDFGWDFVLILTKNTFLKQNEIQTRLSPQSKCVSMIWFVGSTLTTTFEGNAIQTTDNLWLT